MTIDVIGDPESKGSMLLCEGFDAYTPQNAPAWFGGWPRKKNEFKPISNKATMSTLYPLPKRTWWQRLLRRRPAGMACVSFFFAPTGPDGVVDWRLAEAVVHYPEGVESVKLTIETYVNAKPIYFDPVPPPLVTA